MNSRARILPWRDARQACTYFSLLMNEGEAEMATYLIIYDTKKQATAYHAADKQLTDAI